MQPSVLTQETQVINCTEDAAANTVLHISSFLFRKISHGEEKWQVKQKNNNNKNSIRQLTKEDLLGRYVQLQVAEDLREKNSYSSLAPKSLSADECYAICG